MTDDAPQHDTATMPLHIDSKRRKKLRQKKTALGHAEDCITKQREMLIGSRRFCITSVFPAESCATPTEKLLACIDAELEKEAHSA